MKENRINRKPEQRLLDRTSSLSSKYWKKKIIEETKEEAGQVGSVRCCPVLSAKL